MPSMREAIETACTNVLLCRVRSPRLASEGRRWHPLWRRRLVGRSSKSLPPRPTAGWPTASPEMNALFGDDGKHKESLMTYVGNGTVVCNVLKNQLHQIWLLVIDENIVVLGSLEKWMYIYFFIEKVGNQRHLRNLLIGVAINFICHG